jgi:CheY-like chemotaxis protein
MEPVIKGEEAVTAALRENPDLILMDIRLAGDLGGIEAAEKIQKSKNIPIVFMTGYAKEEFLDKINKVKPLGFLEKPVNIYLIRNIIRGLAEHPHG